MPTDKPARLIAKLTDALRAKDVEIVGLRKLASERLDLLERAEASARDVRESIGKLDARLTVVATRNDELDAINVKATDAVTELSGMLHECVASHARLRELVGKLDGNFERVVAALGLPPGGADTDVVVSCVEDLRNKQSALAELEPKTALVEEQRAALVKILDAVRGRMRQRELREESAILNRKAASKVAPERNAR
jgi:hypothetical protein